MAKGRHPIQVVEIRVDDARATRRKRRSNETDVRPAAYLPRARVLDTSDNHRSFSVSLSARVKVPIGEDEMWTANVRLVAQFASEVDVDGPLAEDFTRMSGVFLVWPYARTVLSTLSQMAGVTAPLLPLLTRPGRVAVEPERSRPPQ